MTEITKFNYDGFKLLCKATQDNLYKYLLPNLEAMYEKENVRTGTKWIYAKGDIPLLLVAHMDTVHKELPSVIVCDKEQGYVWSPQGLGADDRCGIYAILTIITHSKKKPCVLFTQDEEIGCLGAKDYINAERKKHDEFKYMLEIDRRGDKEVVYYDTTNKEFMSYVESFGFKKENGMGSDVKHITNDFGIASCNVSAGYRNEHTKYEYLKVSGLLWTINKVLAMVEDIDKAKRYAKS